MKLLMLALENLLTSLQKSFVTSLLVSFILQAALEQEARIAGFKSEVTKSQELHLAGLTRDTERLTNNLEKIRAEIRHASSPLLISAEQEISR